MLSIINLIKSNNQLIEDNFAFKFNLKNFLIFLKNKEKDFYNNSMN